MIDETSLPDDSEQELDGTGERSAQETAELEVSDDDGRAGDPEASKAESSITPEMTIEAASEESQAPALPYPVVAFGASAGGLTAFKEVLENLDPDTGISRRDTIRANLHPFLARL